MSYDGAINAHTIWVNQENLKEQIIEKFDTNTFESVMFSTDMLGDKSQSATFTVYANCICRKLDIATFIFEY